MFLSAVSRCCRGAPQTRTGSIEIAESINRNPEKSLLDPTLPFPMNWIATMLLLLLLSFVSASAQDTLQFYGAYLGQPSPGDIPVLFAPAFFEDFREYHAPIVFSADGSLAYWTPSRAKGRPTSMMTRLQSGVWSPPQEVDFGLEAGATEVTFSPDGETVFFLSRQRREGDPLTPEGRSNPERIWRAPRTPNGTGAPRLLPEAVSSHPTHWQFSVAANGNLYFISWSPEETGTGDIYKAEAVDSGYGEPERLGPEVNSDLWENCVFIAPDESFLLFSRVPEDVNGADLFVSYRLADGSWTQAEPLPPRINSSALDIYPVVSADRKYLFFLSSRDGDVRIYWVNADFLSAQSSEPRR